MLHRPLWTYLPGPVPEKRRPQFEERKTRSIKAPLPRPDPLGYQVQNVKTKKERSTQKRPRLLGHPG